MDLQLSGKRALGTGSGSGIGEATARSLAAEGVTTLCPWCGWSGGWCRA